MSDTVKKPLPINFLLGCSEASLDNYRLQQMSRVANLRRAVQDLMIELQEAMLNVQLSDWFKENDRQTLRAALETEESAMEWAKRMIRGGEIFSLAPHGPGGSAGASPAIMAEKRAAVSTGECCGRQV